MPCTIAVQQWITCFRNPRARESSKPLDTGLRHVFTGYLIHGYRKICFDGKELV